jgi:hypothetical protein
MWKEKVDKTCHLLMVESIGKDLVYIIVRGKVQFLILEPMCMLKKLR